MARFMLSLVAVVALVASTGCAMCASPYDYCGPTFAGGENLPGSGCADGMCNPMARAGSILSPPLGTVAVSAASKVDGQPTQQEVDEPKAAPAEKGTKEPAPSEPARTTRRPQPSAMYR